MCRRVPQLASRPPSGKPFAAGPSNFAASFARRSPKTSLDPSSPASPVGVCFFVISNACRHSRRGPSERHLLGPRRPPQPPLTQRRGSCTQHAAQDKRAEPNRTPNTPRTSKTERGQWIQDLAVHGCPPLLPEEGATIPPQLQQTNLRGRASGAAGAQSHFVARHS